VVKRTDTVFKRIARAGLGVVFGTVLALSVWVPAAMALSGAGITLDQETGGQLTRFTFIASTDASPGVSSLTLSFPQGFDLSKATPQAVLVRQPDLARLPIKYTTERTGRAITLHFNPSLKTSADQLQVKISDVLTPLNGGTFDLGMQYVSGGVSTKQSGVTFAFETPPVGEVISRWFDTQPWVAQWNSVQFMNLFLQPQFGILTLTTVWVGWLLSIGLVVVAFPLAIVGGLMLAFMKMAKIPPVRWIAAIYINVIRGTPLFLQITIAFVGLPIAGLRLPQIPTAVVVLALNSSAYLAEIFRAGIQSINKGQFEAASSLGMTYAQAMGYVVVPQTVKRVLPTMTSEFILLFKDTALLSAVGVFELMLYSNNLVSRSGNITPFVVAACFYLVITVPLINLVARLEAKLAISEGGQAASDNAKKGRNWWRWRPTSAGLEAEFLASPAEHESR
jgi:polar amino acid transport system substrate-binding protein